MNIISKYIGKEVRRIVIAVRKKNGKYYNLFTMIERLNPEMQDRQCFHPNLDSMYCDRVKNADGDSDKVYLAVENVILTEEMLYEPWNSIRVGKDDLYSYSDGFVWSNNSSIIIPRNSDEKNELSSLLPHREITSYIRYCLPKDNSSLDEYIRGNDDIISQMRTLSMRNLGYDVTEHRKYWGAFVYVCYNNIYKTIDFTEDGKNPGVYCRVNYRPRQRVPLLIRFRNYAKDGNVIGDYTLNNGGCFLTHISFGEAFHSQEISVYDKNELLIDYYPKHCYIHSIAFTTNVKSKDVVVSDDKGHVKTVEKYSSAGTSYIGEKSLLNSLFDKSPEFNYKRFEESLDFVFFDGDNNKKEENKKKAKECVMRILNSTDKLCYICDVYFHDGTLVDFVLDMQNTNVEVRILSSKECISTAQKENMKRLIQDFQSKGIGNVSCRLFTGKAVLHDRLIISDDRIWMLGCSLNEFGNRATTLIRVPQEYGGKILAQVNEWWSNTQKSENI